MTYSIKPATLSVALLSVLALSGCPEQQKTDTLAAAASTAAPAAVNALTLDESKLTPAIRFSPSDLDASKSACGDFGGYVNGKLTLGENIADLGGLATAYDALQAALVANPAEASSKIDGYTQDQRFFLNWARVWRGNIRDEAQLVRLNTDPHSPAQFRAIGAPSNMPAFAQAFQCKAGDAMVRPDDARMEIW